MARFIAFYLPQYHPVKENNEWFGEGFTEWTNVAKAKPLFRGHYQPKIPTELGFYDLRMTEIREQQANLAKDAGIEGFCYWHYWFGNGRQLLERPFNEDRFHKRRNPYPRVLDAQVLG
jgi:lipopolysaccharide biosynthesis protein